MRRLLFCLVFFCAAQAHAGPAAVKCTVQLPGGKPEVWHLSADSDKGVYTARLNNVIVKQRKPFELVYTFNNFKPSVTAFKFLIELSPMQQYFVVESNGGLAFTTALSGSYRRQVGRCVDDQFLGL